MLVYFRKNVRYHRIRKKEILVIAIVTAIHKEAILNTVNRPPEGFKGFSNTSRNPICRFHKNSTPIYKLSTFKGFSLTFTNRSNSQSFTTLAIYFIFRLATETYN